MEYTHLCKNLALKQHCEYDLINLILFSHVREVVMEKIWTHDLHIKSWLWAWLSAPQNKFNSVTVYWSEGRNLRDISQNLNK